MAKQMILNEASGMISGMQTELKNLKTQYCRKKYHSGIAKKL
jgi:hypothetical protein